MDERQTVFWAIKNKFNEKTLSWSLGLISIVQLLGGLLLFFMVIFILVDNKVQFLSGVTLYFVIAPLCEFFMVFIAFNLVISKKRKTMPAAIYFTLSSLAKFLLMLLCDIIALMLEDFNGLNLKIVFVLCLVMLALSITSLVLLCLLAVHCSKVQ